MPDLIRHPPRPSSSGTQGRWTPDQVRRDGSARNPSRSKGRAAPSAGRRDGAGNCASGRTTGGRGAPAPGRRSPSSPHCPPHGRTGRPRARRARKNRAAPRYGARVGDQRVVIEVVDIVGIEAPPVRHQPPVLAVPVRRVVQVLRIGHGRVEMQEIERQDIVERLAAGVDDPRLREQALISPIWRKLSGRLSVTMPAPGWIARSPSR